MVRSSTRRMSAVCSGSIPRARAAREGPVSISNAPARIAAARRGLAKAPAFQTRTRPFPPGVLVAQPMSVSASARSEAKSRNALGYCCTTSSGTSAGEIQARPAAARAGAAATAVSRLNGPMTPTTSGSIVSFRACIDALLGSPSSFRATSITP